MQNMLKLNVFDIMERKSLGIAQKGVSVNIFVDDSNAHSQIIQYDKKSKINIYIKTSEDTYILKFLFQIAIFLEHSIIEDNNLDILAMIKFCF